MDLRLKTTCINSVLVYKYDSVSNFWYLEKSAGGAKPQARYRHASARIRNSLFIFGGINQHQRKYASPFNLGSMIYTNLTSTPKNGL